METQNTQIQFLNALLAGDRIRCSEISSKVLDNRHSITELYELVIKKSLYDIGDLWEMGKISVATEHLASAIVEANLNEFYYKVISNSVKINKTVVTACVENEYHQIGVKMVTDIFELNGWNAHFLGANTPSKELIVFLKEIKPDFLAISLCLYFHLPQLEELIVLVSKELSNLPILVGGQAFRHGGLDVLKKYKNVSYLPDLDSLELLLKKMK